MSETMEKKRKVWIIIVATLCGWDIAYVSASYPGIYIISIGITLFFVVSLGIMTENRD